MGQLIPLGLAGLTRLPPWYCALRTEALGQIRDLLLARRILGGDHIAFRALISCMWTYMCNYGPAIATYAPESFAIGRAVRDEPTLKLIVAHRTRIRRSEGGHADLWLELAKSHGVELLVPPRSPGPALRRLLATLVVEAHDAFYVGLTTTQMLGWILSTIARESPFYACGDRRWFDAHLAEHRPTHEAMYLWIACELIARSGEEDVRRFFIQGAEHIIALFSDVARELWLEVKASGA